MRALTLILCGLLSVQTVLFVAPSNAHALEPDTRTVLKSGLYGTLAGAGAGVLSRALGSNTRSIFVGASVGLYMGLVLGFYYIWDRDPYAVLEKRDQGPETNRELASRDVLESRQLPAKISFDFRVASF